MEGDVVARHKRCLHCKQKNPGAEYGSVYLDEKTANVRVIDSGQIVGAGESKKYRAQDEQRHCPKEEIIGASPGSYLS